MHVGHFPVYKALPFGTSQCPSKGGWGGFTDPILQETKPYSQDHVTGNQEAWEGILGLLVQSGGYDVSERRKCSDASLNGGPWPTMPVFWKTSSISFLSHLALGIS